MDWPGSGIAWVHMEINRSTQSKRDGQLPISLAGPLVSSPAQNTGSPGVPWTRECSKVSIGRRVLSDWCLSCGRRESPIRCSVCVGVNVSFCRSVPEPIPRGVQVVEHVHQGTCAIWCNELPVICFGGISRVPGINRKSTGTAVDGVGSAWRGEWRNEGQGP